MIDVMPRTRWVPASMLSLGEFERVAAEMQRASLGPGWNPKPVRLRRDLYAFDFCCHPEFRGGGLHSVHVMILKDSPHINAVPPKYRGHFKKSVRLAVVRMDSFPGPLAGFCKDGFPAVC